MKDTDKDVFNLEYQYQEYLKKVKLKESEMGETQRIETRRTFMGACGVMLIVLRHDLSALKEDEAAKMLQNMLDQVGNFFIKEVNRQN